MYLNYVVYLQKKGEFLEYLTFQAWTYGPVIPALYIYYKDLGFNSNDLITRRVGSEGSFPVLQKDKTIGLTVKRYAKLDTFQLIDLTHKEGGAWDVAFRKGHNQEIDREDIKKEFCHEL